MQKLTISNLGPVSDCSIEIIDFMVFTGSQASGKSTIAKSIFYFNHLKDVLLDIVRKSIERPTLFETAPLKERFVRTAADVFYQSFGEEEDINGGGLYFTYDNESKINVVINNGDVKGIDIVCSDVIIEKLSELEVMAKKSKIKELDEIRRFIDCDIFACDRDVIYIPAGRSLHTMLTAQINYLYSVMDDMQKSTLDYCTKCYIEEVFRIKDFFNQSPEQLAKRTLNRVGLGIEEEKVQSAIILMKKILQGEYRNVNGSERLFYNQDKSVKLNYASSGQQEAVWITNMLFYHMLGQRPTCFIIEEPETHLFPNAQKLITEFIALIKNGKNYVVLTTHSPYILGSINNLLYANDLSEKGDKDKLSEIINRDFWLDYSSLGAYFLDNGVAKDIKDKEFADINHDVIDGASLDINDAYERMVELKFETEGETV